MYPPLAPHRTLAHTALFQESLFHFSLAVFDSKLNYHTSSGQPSLTSLAQSLKHHASLFSNTQHNCSLGDFPGDPVVKTLPSNAAGAGSIPDQGAKIPHASQPKQNKTKQKNPTKQKQYGNKFSKDFKLGPHQKKILKN